jgi:hypothetical protein
MPRYCKAKSLQEYCVRSEAYLTSLRDISRVNSTSVFTGFVANILGRPGGLMISLLKYYSKVSVVDPVFSSRNVDYINIGLLQIPENVKRNIGMTNQLMSQNFRESRSFGIAISNINLC